MAKKKELTSKQWEGMPTDEATLKEIKAAIESTYEAYSTIENAKVDLKDIYEDLRERTGIPKKIFNFLAKTNYKGNGYEQIQQNRDIEEAYDQMQKVDI